MELPMRPPPSDEEAQLTARLTGMLPAGAIGAVRRIQPGDEQLLTAAEQASLPAQLPGQRRSSGASRALARELCATIGAPATDLVRSATGVPLWPRQVVGSLAYDEAFAAAVVGRSDVLRGIGLEIEHIELPDEDLLGLVAGPLELRSVRATTHDMKRLCAIREAVYKALHPRDRSFLEFNDIRIDFESRLATTHYGRRVSWRLSDQHLILAVAWW
jgi:4'-phosphopantetheinyl transferase EntD